MSKITRMGIDLDKNTFHVCATDRSGRVVLEKRFTRRGLEKFVRAHERCVVGMEGKRRLAPTIDSVKRWRWMALLRGGSFDAARATRFEG